MNANNVLEALVWAAENLGEPYMHAVAYGLDHPGEPLAIAGAVGTAVGAHYLERWRSRGGSSESDRFRASEAKRGREGDDGDVEGEPEAVRRKVEEEKRMAPQGFVYHKRKKWDRKKWLQAQHRRGWKSPAAFVRLLNLLRKDRARRLSAKWKLGHRRMLYGGWSREHGRN